MHKKAGAREASKAFEDCTPLLRKPSRSEGNPIVINQVVEKTFYAC
jgi:hypothetical protein